MKIFSRVTVLLCLFLCLFTPLTFAQDDVAVLPETDQDVAADEDPADPETSLPAKYDLRDLNGADYITPVKQQGVFGTCWAHAAISAAESNSILKGGSPTVNLSEKALAWYTYHLQGSKDITSDEYEGLDISNFNVTWLYGPSAAYYSLGGSKFMALSQMCTWNGASTEAEVPFLNSDGEYGWDPVNGTLANPYGDWSLPYDDIYDDAYHLQDSELIYGPWWGELSSADFTTQTKELMLKYGALVLGYHGFLEANEYFNGTTNAQYIDVPTKGNHDVTIVGWDDNYPASNFNITPPGDGAWIIKNSWGVHRNDNGYFYLSYYDQSIQDVKGFNIETEQNGFSYDKNNQYDFHNIKGEYDRSPIQKVTETYNLASLPEGTIKMANVFTSNNDETLRAVSALPFIYGTAKVTANVYLLNDNFTTPEDGQLVATVTENFEHSGFYTLELPEAIPLVAGTKYAVVEELTYYNARFEGNDDDLGPVIPSLPGLAIEYGLEEPVITDMVNQEGNTIGFSFQENVVTSKPGQSYVYGLNGTIGVTPPAWMDITSPEITDKLTCQIEVEGQDGSMIPNTAYPGNVMIKAFTTYGIGDDVINPSSIAVTTPATVLSTLEGARNSFILAAVLEPGNSTTKLNWSVSPSNIVSITGSGESVTVTALNEGVATVTVTTGNDLVATSTVTVTNDELRCDGIEIMQNTPDRLSVVLRNLRANSALADYSTISPERVSLFMWSEKNQSDINAKVMENIAGTSDWIYEGIPVNDTAINNYFIDASDIKINVYASTDYDSNGNLIEIGQCQWVTPGTSYDASVAYIAYCQNTGFVKPTVWNGATSGNIGDPDSTHLEGFRISSGMLGIEINSQAYAKGLGWLPEVGDGCYVGTMGQDRALESIKLFLNSTIPDLDKLFTFQYRVYLKDTGWTSWVDQGQEAGTPGSGNPIQAIQVTLIPLEFNVPTGQ